MAKGRGGWRSEHAPSAPPASIEAEPEAPLTEADALDEHQEAAPVEPTPVAAQEAKPATYKVAPGRALTSRKGIVDQGELVTAEILGTDEAGFQALLDAGAVTKA